MNISLHQGYRLKHLCTRSGHKHDNISMTIGRQYPTYTKSRIASQLQNCSTHPAQNGTVKLQATQDKKKSKSISSNPALQIKYEALKKIIRLACDLKCWHCVLNVLFFIMVLMYCKCPSSDAIHTWLTISIHHTFLYNLILKLIT